MSRIDERKTVGLSDKDKPDSPVRSGMEYDFFDGVPFTEENFEEWCADVGGEYSDEWDEQTLKDGHTGEVKSELSGLKQKCEIVLDTEISDYTGDEVPSESVTVEHDPLMWDGDGEMSISVRSDDLKRGNATFILNGNTTNTGMPDDEVATDVPSIDGVRLTPGGMQLPMKNGRAAEWEKQGGPTRIMFDGDEVRVGEMSMDDDDPRTQHL
jgi:hypothetical protein